MKISYRIVLFTSLLALAACAPRGESKSLEEVLVASKERYAAVQQVRVKSEISTILKRTLVTLEGIEKNSGKVTQAEAKQIVEDLGALEGHASYTVRPALAELTSQYIELAGDRSAYSNAVLLLVSRTYSLLASELETTKFSL